MFRDIVVTFVTVLIVGGIACAAGEWGKSGSNPTLVTSIKKMTENQTLFATAKTKTSGTICYLDYSGRMSPASNYVAYYGKGMLGLAMANISGTTAGQFLTYGTYSAPPTFKVWSTGRPYYLGTSGTITKVEPTSSGNISRIVGWGMRSTKFFFAPDSGTVTK